WTGKALFLKSFGPTNKPKEYTHAANLLYSSRRLSVGWQHEYVGENHVAEVGYVPRRGYIKLNPTAGYLFFPKSESILSHGPKISSSHYFDDQFHETDNETYLSYMLTFRSQSTFTGWVAHNYVELLQPFDPTNFLLDSLAVGSRHFWNSFGT